MIQIPNDRLRPHLVPAIGLILLTLLVYGRTVGFDFLSNWDDYQYVTGNPDIQGISARNLARIFTSSYVGNYAPVHLLSYMADFQLAGLNPAWFHGVNVVIHAANGLLFYLLVLRLTGKPFWAFASSALFLVHPAQVESVAWISQRKNLLAMFFSLCSFLSYVAYLRGGGQERRRFYLFSLLFLALALFSKSIAVIVPFAFLLHDIFIEESGRRKGMLVDKVPYLLAVALVSGITIYTQSEEMGGGIVDFFDGDTAAKILTMLPVLAAYLRILLWPTDQLLNSIYIFVIKTRFDGEVAAALLAALLLIIAGTLLYRKERRLFFGFALFFLGLVPVSQIVPLATLMNDRYLYFPMLGGAWLAGGLLCRCREKWPEWQFSPAAVLLILLLVPLGAVSWQRSAVWRNAIALWSDVVRKLPDLRDPRAALAAAYLYDNQKSRALAVYEELFALKREFSDPMAERKALLEAANLYLENRSAAKAFPLLLSLTEKYPDYQPGFIKLGYGYYLERRLPEAEQAYRKALLLKPASAPAMVGLGNICLETGRVAEARSWYLKSYENGGNTPDLQFSLACVESLAKNYAASLKHLEEAVKMGYRNLDAINGNPELAAVRKLPPFKDLMARYFGSPG